MFAHAGLQQQCFLEKVQQAMASRNKSLLSQSEVPTLLQPKSFSLCCCCCQVLVNDELEEGYKQLKAAISRFRPDLIPPAAHEAAAKAAQAAAALTPVPLLVAGPAGGFIAVQLCAANTVSMTFGD